MSIAGITAGVVTLAKGGAAFALGTLAAVPAVALKAIGGGATVVVGGGTVAGILIGRKIHKQRQAEAARLKNATNEATQREEGLTEAAFLRGVANMYHQGGPQPVEQYEPQSTLGQWYSEPRSNDDVDFVRAAELKRREEAELATVVKDPWAGQDTFEYPQFSETERREMEAEALNDDRVFCQGEWRSREEAAQIDPKNFFIWK